MESGFLAAAKEWLSLISLAVSVGGALYAFLTVRSRGNSEKIDKLEKDIEEKLKDRGKKVDAALTVHDERLTQHGGKIRDIEHELKHLPDKDTVNDLRLTITKMEGVMTSMGDAMGTISKTVDRIDNYLREKGK